MKMTRTLACVPVVVALTACGGDMGSPEKNLAIGQDQSELGPGLPGFDNPLCHELNVIWKGANDLAGAIPDVTPTSRLVNSISKIAERLVCPDKTELDVLQIRDMIEKAIDTDDLEDMTNALGNFMATTGPNTDPTHAQFSNYATTMTLIESEGFNIGFPAIQVQAQVASLKYAYLVGMYNKAPTESLRQTALDQIDSALRQSLMQLEQHRVALENHIQSNIAIGSQTHWSGDSVRGFVEFIDHGKHYTGSFPCVGPIGIGNNYNCGAAIESARAAAQALRPSVVDETRRQILTDEYFAVEANLFRALYPTNVCQITSYSNPGLVLNIENGSLAASAASNNVYATEFNKQLWRIDNRDGDYYVSFTSHADPNRFINTETGLAASYNWNGQSMHWALHRDANEPNTYRIQNRWWGNFLVIRNGALAMGNETGPESKWVFNDECARFSAESHEVRIESYTNPGELISTESGSLGLSMSKLSESGGNRQFWKIEPIAEGSIFYRVISSADPSRVINTENGLAASGSTDGADYWIPVQMNGMPHTYMFMKPGLGFLRRGANGLELGAADFASMWVLSNYFYKR